jgi:hypothetical protein
MSNMKRLLDGLSDDDRAVVERESARSWASFVEGCGTRGLTISQDDEVALLVEDDVQGNLLGKKIIVDNILDLPDLVGWGPYSTGGGCMAAHKKFSQVTGNPCYDIKGYWLLTSSRTGTTIPGAMRVPSILALYYDDEPDDGAAEAVAVFNCTTVHAALSIVHAFRPGVI